MREGGEEGGMRRRKQSESRRRRGEKKGVETERWRAVEELFLSPAHVLILVGYAHCRLGYLPATFIQLNNTTRGACTVGWVSLDQVFELGVRAP